MIESAIGLLLPYQILWLNDESDVAVWEKSRRIGASYDDALKSVLYAAKNKADGGMNCYYMSYNKDMTEQYIRDCAFWAKLIGAAASQVEEIILNDDDKDILIFQIRFASGHVVQALPSSARNIRSKQGRIILDEAAFTDAFAEILKAAIALLMWGGKLAIMSTHNGVDNPFNELIENIKAGRFDYALHRTSFQEAIAQGLYKAICRARGIEWSTGAEKKFVEKIYKDYGDSADEELDCIPSKSGGAYIPISLIETAMTLPPENIILRLEAPSADFVDWPKAALDWWIGAYIQEQLEPFASRLNKKLRHAAGQDIGRYSDLTVLCILAEEENLEHSTALILEMNNIPFNVQLALTCAVLRSSPNFSGAAVDATGIGASLAESLRQEWGPGLIHEIKLSESWYATNMPPLKGRFEDKNLKLPKDVYLRDDLRQIKKISGIPKLDTLRVKTKSGQRHGDGAMALALAEYAFRHAPEILADWKPTFPNPSEIRRMLENFNR